MAGGQAAGKQASREHLCVSPRTRRTTTMQARKSKPAWLPWRKRRTTTTTDRQTATAATFLVAFTPRSLARSLPPSLRPEYVVCEWSKAEIVQVG